MKKLLIITDLPIWSIEENKGAQSFYQTYVHLDKNYDVTLLTTDENYTRDQQDKKIILNKILKFQLKIRFLNFIFGILCYFINLIFTFLLNYEEIKRSDIVYFYEIEFTPLAYWIRLFWPQKKIISRFQGTVLQDQDCKNWKNIIKNYKHVLSISTQVNLLVMTDDGTNGDKIVELLNPKQRYLFLKNGLDIGYICNEALRDKHEKIDLKKFITISRLVGWKNVNQSINYFREFALPNSQLLVIGDGPERDKLIKQNDDLLAHGSLIFKGAIDHTLLKEILENAHYYLGSFSLSNLGNGLYEAMAHGVIPIVTNSGNTSSFIKHGDNGFLISNSSDLEGIFSTITNAKECLRIAENAKRTAVFMNTWEERMAVEIKAIANAS